MPDASEGSRATEIDDPALRGWPLPEPAGDGDKEARGLVLVVAGSKQMPGAAVLAATAAFRAGAGKVTIATPASIARAMAFAVPESLVIALGETEQGGIAAAGLGDLDPLVEKAKAVLIGPGLPNETSTCDLTGALLEKFLESAFVIDAAAMDVVGTRGVCRMRFSAPVLMTPHAGEMAHLSGAEKSAVEAHPQAAALEAARTWNAVVALKGAVTWIAAPDGRLWRHEGGNMGLATSGSGDVLSGITAGLVARGAPPEQAVAWSVALHARAGDALAQRLGPLGYLAREISGEVPSIMAALSRR